MEDKIITLLNKIRKDIDDDNYILNCLVEFKNLFYEIGYKAGQASRDEKHIEIINKLKQGKYTVYNFACEDIIIKIRQESASSSK